MDSEGNRIPLASAIAGLRKEIAKATEQALPLNPKERFKITEVEIELSAVAEETIDGGGEINWWIIKGKSSASIKDSSTQKIKIKLNVGDAEVGSETETM